MKIDIFIDSLSRTKALRRYASLKLRQALKRHSGSVRKTEMKLRDINAEKGGLDKECVVVVETSSGTLVTKAIHSEPGGAVRSALKKLLRNLRQRFERFDKPNKHQRRRARSMKYAVG